MSRRVIELLVRTTCGSCKRSRGSSLGDVKIFQAQQVAVLQALFSDDLVITCSAVHDGSHADDLRASLAQCCHRATGADKVIAEEGLEYRYLLSLEDLDLA